MNIQFNNHIFKITKFSIVGVISTVIDFALFCIFVYFFQWDIIISHLAAFLIALMNSYFLNKHFTFGDRDIAYNMKLFGKFILFNSIGAIISTIAILILIKYIHIILAKVMAATLSLLWNYISSYFFIFTDKIRHNM